MSSYFYIAFALLLTFPLLSHAYPLNPDPQLTPGQLCTTQHDDFYEFRYQEKIPYCKRKVRTSRKKQIYRDYNIPLRCKHRFTIDHFIPLSIGGDNSDENLWPEHKDVKATRQALETQLYWALRKGEMTQEEAVDTVIYEKTKEIELLKSIPKSTKWNSDCDIPDPN